MSSAETKSWGTFCPRPCWVNRAICSWRIKLGSFWENWNVASRALSIKGALGGSEGVGTESAASDSAGGGSGQGGRAGSPLFFKVGTSEQGGGLCACDWALAGVVAKASAKATTAPAMRSQRPVCRRLYPFTDSPCLESSTIRGNYRAGWRSVVRGQLSVKIKRPTQNRAGWGTLIKILQERENAGHLWTIKTLYREDRPG